MSGNAVNQKAGAVNESQVRLVAFLFMFVSVSALAGHEPAFAASSDEPPSKPPPNAQTQESSLRHAHYWQSLSDPQGFVGVTYLSQDAEAPLQGVKLSSGLLNEFPVTRGVIRRNEFDSWLSRNGNDEQTIWSAGLGCDLIYALAWGPVRAIPRGGLGLEYRTESPDHGLGVFASIGLNFDIWLGRHVTISAGIDRRYSYPGNDYNEIGFTVRFRHPRIPALIPMA